MSTAGPLTKLRGLLEAHAADLLLLTFLPDVRWACGFTGSSGLLLVGPERAHFLTDGRYRVQAREEVHGPEIHVGGPDLLEHAAEAGLLGGARRVVLQAEHVTLAQQAALRRLFPEVCWIIVENLMDRLVASKTEEEVRRIRRAQHVTAEVFEEVLPLMRPGVTERDLAAEIVYRHLRRGAERMAFDPIVASGPRGALPHARPTGKRLEQGALVVLDFGCFVDGYASDMTRTVAVGEPGPEARAVHQLVLEAQAVALDAARAGMASCALDQAARDVITAGGYGDYFTHGLGHGVGLQVHEWPRVSHNTDYDLPEGAVVTIEPGVYLPGRFGVRIEDLIVLRAEGCDNLTQAPKELIVL